MARGDSERGVFIAAFRGPCGLCDEDIRDGDEAVYVDDEPCHLRCAEIHGEIDGE